VARGSALVVVPAPVCRLARMGYDVQAIRAHFPALAAGARTSTGRAGRRSRHRGRRRRRTLLSPLANRGSVTAAERPRTRRAGARAAMGDLLGRDPRGVVFGRSMTALTFDLARTLAATWGPATR
jgi:selenocysteine lyase/cysteine desulfurase